MTRSLATLDQKNEWRILILGGFHTIPMMILLHNCIKVKAKMKILDQTTPKNQKN